MQHSLDGQPTGISARRSRGGARATAQLGSAWVDQVRDSVPNVDKLVEEGLAAIRADGFREELARTEFGKWLVAAQKAVEKIHREREAEALSKLVDLIVTGVAPPSQGEHVMTWARTLLARAAPEFVAFEFRAGQTRKARAGSVWEKLGDQFLRWNDIICEKPTGKEDRRKLRQIDRVVPSVRVAIDTPDQAVRLSFKTEAREKWRVLVDESRTGHVYLITMGEDLTVDKIPEMAGAKIVVFVPAQIKESNPEFQKATNIRTLDDLPKNLRRYAT
jgi:hypothetical protein